MQRLQQVYKRGLGQIDQSLWRIELIACIPALALGWVYFGLAGLGVVSALILPIIILTAGVSRRLSHPVSKDSLTGLPLRDACVHRLETWLAEGDADGKLPSVFVVEIDDFHEIEDRVGRTVADELLPKVANRLSGVVRDDDLCVRLEGPRFAFAINPNRRVRLEMALQMCERVQTELAEPYSVDASTLRLTASLGFCLGSRSPMPGGEALLEAAQVAAEEARRVGHAAVRAYSSEMRQSITNRNALVDDILTGFEEGHFRPWFQPQIDAETGTLTGLEALARWEHPENGTLPPVEFLDAMETTGLIEQLGEVMLNKSLAALAKWEKEGVIIPTIGVNFSSAELRNPKLVDRITWELDRHNLSPDRLTIEVLETVVAETEDDTITRNIAALATLGCNIDLDDFGTGHASISNIRRFAIGRIKIDRSFVMKMHEDTEQYKMVSAILLMARQLDLDTLAEGVENKQQREMLHSLGCRHLQGYGISRPIPFEEVKGWLDSVTIEANRSLSAH